MMTVTTEVPTIALVDSVTGAETDLLAEGLAQSKTVLQDFFAQPDWMTQFQDVFGAGSDAERSQSIAIAFSQGNFQDLPPIEILSASVLNGASGGFDTASGKIYVCETLLQDAKGDISRLKSVLLEEIGHYIDAQVNRNDTTGDEGDRFANLVQGVVLSDSQLQRINAEDDHATIWLAGHQHVIEQATALPNFSIRTEGTFTVNGGSDLDGDPLNLQDDALVYAGKGFTINGNATLPVQRDALGNVITSSGKPLLVNNALTVGTGYTTLKGPSNSYAGLVPPPVIAPQSIVVPAYVDLKAQTLASRVPANSTEIIFNLQQTPLNTPADWIRTFPPAGTTTQPTVIRITNGGLNIPSKISLKNYVIQVDSGDINFNGTGNTLENVVLIANGGNINLGNVIGKDLAVLASGSINANGGSQFSGSTFLANASTSGSINFNGSTKTTTGTDQVQVISQGSITYNGLSSTRGSFLSVGTFIVNGLSSLYGSIGAKGNIIFNGKTTVIGTSIRPLNAAPTDLSLSPSSIAENGAISAVVGNFNTSDPNTGDTFTYSLVTGTGSTDNASFSIVGNQLKINASPDFEAKSSYSIRVKTTDQGGLSSEKALTVNILNVNEAPTSIALTNTSVPENSGTGTIIGQLSTTDPDQSDTQQYTLTDSAGDRFELIGNTLQVKAGAVLDFETTPSLSIEVQSTDAGGLSTSQRFAIALTNVNEAPTAIHLSTTSIGENTPVGTAIATFSATDPDANDTQQYSLVSGSGDGDNAAFVILGDQLQLQSAANYALHPNYSVRVRATDAGGLNFEKVLTIAVTDTTAPLINGGLSHDTGNSTDGLTSDPSIQGQVSDNGTISQLRARFDGQPQTQSIQFALNNGQYQLTRSHLEALYGYPLGDGAYTLNIEALDAAGNISTVGIPFTLDTTAPATLTVNLSADSDTGPVGDFKTQKGSVIRVKLSPMRRSNWSIRGQR